MRGTKFAIGVAPLNLVSILLFEHFSYAACKAKKGLPVYLGGYLNKLASTGIQDTVMSHQCNQ